VTSYLKGLLPPLKNFADVVGFSNATSFADIVAGNQSGLLEIANSALPPLPEHADSGVKRRGWSVNTYVMEARSVELLSLTDAP
jgi:hypothetical protein